MQCAEQQHGQLSRGVLAIVKADGRYHLVPAGVADKIALRDSASVIVNNVKQAIEGDEDDPYAEFKVPDDLMW